MKPSSTWFLRAAIGVSCGFVLFICVLLLPAFTDARNYEFIPLVSILYAAVGFFYAAVYQTWKILGHIDRNTAFSRTSVKALHKIKYYALSVSGLFMLGSPFFFNIAQHEDAPGVMALCLIIVFASASFAVFVAVLQKLLQNAIALKSENDLTV